MNCHGESQIMKRVNLSGRRTEPFDSNCIFYIFFSFSRDPFVGGYHAPDHPRYARRSPPETAADRLARSGVETGDAVSATGVPHKHPKTRPAPVVR